MIRIESIVETSLPVLSWVASMRRNDLSVRVLRGNSCDARVGQFVLEGTWSGGDLDSELPCDRPFNCSTGIAVRADRIWAWTPSHPYDKLFVVRDERAVVISNSLVALFSVLQDAPDPNCIDYHDRLTSYTKGVSLEQPQLPTRDGRSVEVYVAAVLKFDLQLSMTREARADLPRASTYGELFRVLDDACADLVRNAHLEWRTLPLRPLSTVSSGFDSTAVSVFAQRAGCVEALALLDPRESFSDSDDGRPIAESLGLSVHSARRSDYRALPGHPEALFLASGVGGEDVVLSPFERELRGALLFTGIGGDTVWNIESSDPSASRDFIGRYFGGASLQEYRVSTGFCHVPLPKMLWPIHSDLHAISNSPEMTVWRTGSSGYIRPIPTRLAVEAGIKRGLFGQTKKAVTQPFYHNVDLSYLLTARSQESFSKFLEGLPQSTGAHRGIAVMLRLLRSPLAKAVESVLVRLLRRPIEFASVVPARIVATHTGYSYCFHWAHTICSVRSTEAGRKWLGSLSEKRRSSTDLEVGVANLIQSGDVGSSCQDRAL